VGTPHQTRWASSSQTAIIAANTWVITAGVRLHGRARAIADAIAATPAATMSSITISAIAFDDRQDCPDAESMT
jgi:hypothetical protein